MKNIIKSTAVALAIVGSASAFAGNYDSQTVRYSADELNTERGRAAVYRELRLAVEAVCGSTNLRKAGSLYNKQQNEACVDAKLDEMIDKIGHRELSSMHRNEGVIVGD